MTEIQTLLLETIKAMQEEQESMKEPNLEFRNKAQRVRTNAERLADNSRRTRQNAECTLASTKRSFELMQGLRTRFDKAISRCRRFVEKLEGLLIQLR